MCILHPHPLNPVHIERLYHYGRNEIVIIIKIIMDRLDEEITCIPIVQCLIVKQVEISKKEGHAPLVDGYFSVSQDSGRKNPINCSIISCKWCWLQFSSQINYTNLNSMRVIPFSVSPNTNRALCTLPAYKNC